jgi:hypothetical protein
MSPDTPKNENVYSPENIVSRDRSPITPKLFSRNVICNEAIYIYIWAYTANNLNLNSKSVANFCSISKFLFILFLYTKISSGNPNDSLQNPGCETLN